MTDPQVGWIVVAVILIAALLFKIGYELYSVGYAAGEEYQCKRLQRKWEDQLVKSKYAEYRVHGDGDGAHSRFILKGKNTDLNINFERERGLFDY